MYYVLLCCTLLSVIVECGFVSDEVDNRATARRSCQLPRDAAHFASTQTQVIGSRYSLLVFNRYSFQLFVIRYLLIANVNCCYFYSVLPACRMLCVHCKSLACEM